MTDNEEQVKILETQTVTPYEAISENGFDYQRLIEKFGTKPITPELMDKFEQITGHPAHPWMRRGIFFSHRGLNDLLDKYAKGESIYIYTGRGPSSDSMTLGHALPFVFCKWLQKVFDAQVVIQIADDEKFFFKNLSLDQVYRMGVENAKDIIAFGFDPQKTFIFSNIDYLCPENRRNIIKLMKAINLNTIKKIYGFTDDANCGMIQWPFNQMSPAFSSSFPHLFGERKDITCLIPCAIDQDPYFRSARDIAPKMKWKKPCLIHGKFLVGLKGIREKMSSSNKDSAIFLSDTPNQVKNKIMRKAFSGGQDDGQQHREKGANLDVDVTFQYLSFFEEDDEQLQKIGEEYQSGRMLSGQIKKYLVDKLVPFIQEHQQRRQSITQDVLEQYYVVKNIL